MGREGRSDKSDDTFCHWGILLAIIILFVGRITTAGSELIAEEDTITADTGTCSGYNDKQETAESMKTPDTNGSKQVLSRQRRYLSFPSGSSLQVGKYDAPTSQIIFYK